MELKKFIRYLGWELLLLGIFLLAVSSIPETVFSSSVARDAKQITLTFSGKHKPTAGTLFRLYCVAQESGDGLVVTEDFAGAGVSLALDADEWGGMATALEGYVLEQNTLYDEMLPNATALSDRSGKVEFPNLAEGVYLITGEEWNNGSYAFVPSASLVQLSGEDVSVTATYLTRNRTLPGEAITMEVVSIWNDGGNKNLRPQFVTVSLFCDGILYDQAILNEDNNWRHTWTKLTSASRWQLSGGEAPESYSVELTNEDNEFVLLYDLTEKEGEDESASIRVAASDSQSVEREETSHLTVQLWWPVPLLAVCGVILFCFGVKLYRKQMEYDEEER